MVAVAWLIASAALIAVVIIYYFYARNRDKLVRTKTLFEVSMLVNSTLDRRELQQLIMDTAAKTMNAEASSILLIDLSTQELYFELALGDKGQQVQEVRLQPGEGIAGLVAGSGKPIIVNHPEQDPRWSKRVSSRTGVITRNLLCVPIINRGQVIGVLQVLNKRDDKSFTEADQTLLTLIAGPMAVALENARLFEELKRTTEAKNKMESEMRIAGEIQLSFLPRGPLPDALTRQWEVEALLLPAKQAGGDFYHYELLDERHLFFTLGDVSDKGMPAALFMAAAVTLIKGTLKSGMPPSELLRQVNDRLCKDNPTQFATVICGILSLDDGRVSLSDGGHCTPFLVQHDGTVQPLQLVKGLPLGAWEDAEYYDTDFSVLPGSKLVLYTDGIIEAENSALTQYSMTRLSEFLQKNSMLSGNTLAKQLISDVVAFASGAPQSDDIAVLSIGYKSATEG